MTWRNMSLEALELAFNPRATARNVDERVAAYAAAAAETRAHLHPVLDVRYGPGEKETLDIFPAVRPDAPVHLFIHGGYWRAMDKSDYSFIANVFQPAGATTVLINYALCPAVTLDTIVAQVNRAIAWTWRNIADHGGDPHRLYVSGNSAGGHLTAMALAHDWSAAEGLPADIIKGAAPITGVFDCEPVPDITVNEEVRLDRETARRLSPLRNPPRHALPLLVAVGGAEPPLWIRMSKDYAALCRAHGIECEYMELPGHDHFDISRAPGDPDSPLAREMLRMMGL